MSTHPPSDSTADLIRSIQAVTSVIAKCPEYAIAILGYPVHVIDC